MYRLIVNDRVVGYGKKKELQGMIDWYKQEWKEKGWTWKIIK